MSEPKIRLQPIHLHLTNADAVVPADHAPLFSRFASLAAAVNQAWQQRADVSSDRADVNYSGKFLMRVPKRLHSELAHAAKAQGVSLNQYVLYLLTKSHGDRVKRVA